VYTNNCAILGLDLCIVVAVPGARFGAYFDEQFVQPCGDVAINLLRDSVRVKYLDDEGEAFERRFEHRDDEGFDDVRVQGTPTESKHLHASYTNLRPNRKKLTGTSTESKYLQASYMNWRPKCKKLTGTSTKSKCL
jgi:hypothetical protein